MPRIDDVMAEVASRGNPDATVVLQNGNWFMILPTGATVPLPSDVVSAADERGKRPRPRFWPSVGQFFASLTQAERMAIRAAMKTDATLDDAVWLFQLQNGSVAADNQTTKDFLALLVQKKMLTQVRVNELTAAT